MKNSAIIFILLLLNASILCAQGAPNPSPAASTDDYSGMYAFLQEGEFVQLTVEDQGLVTGLISHYDDATGEQRGFVDQFFKQGKLDGQKLTFTTEAAHNAWYDFQGTVERGDGQNTDEQGYYVLKGKLTHYKTDANKKTTSKSETVAFKSFPKDLSSPAK
jgi:hypothetical protein